MTILLPAHPHHDLEWKEQASLAEQALASGESLFWQIDYGWEKGALNLKDSALFQSHALVLDQFVKLFGKYQEKTRGVSLYCGPLDFSERLLWNEEMERHFAESMEEGIDKELFCTNLFAAFCHRLSSILPEEITPYCLFEVHTIKSPAKCAQLVSKARFEHIVLEIRGSSLDFKSRAQAAILLPADAHCTAEVLAALDEKIDQLQKEGTPFRVIHERFLTEEWDGLDLLYVLEEAVSPQAQRKLHGFAAAGGRVVKT